MSKREYSITFEDLSQASIHYWLSDWGAEWEPRYMSALAPLDIGVISGRSSKGHHPFIIIEDGNQAHFLAVAWSGNWQITCTSLNNQVLITVESDSTTTNILSKTVLSGGIDRAMREFIDEFRALDLHKRPKLLTEWNSWWPYEDTDISESLLLANAALARKAGIEVAVLDAGWFGPSLEGSHWHHVRGDWQERNGKRFPSGLKIIAQEVRNLGIGFGIWLEVEALGENAELAKTHPEFVAQRDGENLGYVCFANPAAFSWALELSKNLIEECDATWIKIDFNVDPGAGCNRGDHGHEPASGLHGHLNNLYSLLDLLKTDYPDLTVENCSSGGLRWDISMAAHVDFGFSSDPDWPEHALSCFWASSLFFPAEKLLGWCDSQWRGNHPHQNFSAIDSSDSDLEFALSITLLGGFGISARLPEFSEKKMSILTDYVSIYKKHFRPRFQDSAYIRHLSAQPERESKGCRTVAFAIETQSYGPLVTIYQLDGELRLASIEYLPPKSDAFYKITNVVSGHVLHPSHQGVFIFHNTLSDNSSIILGFEEINV